MGLIRRSDQNDRAKNAVAIDLGDIRAQAEQIITAAKSQAADIVAQAVKERERLVSTAHTDGFGKGHAEGRVKGHSDGMDEGRRSAVEQAKPLIDATLHGWRDALGRFEEERRKLIDDAREDVVKLAVAIATRVTKRAVELKPELIVDQIREALALITKPTRLVVAVHPEDVAIVELAWPSLFERLVTSAEASLVGDATLARGSCILRTGADGRGVIDASISTQVDRLVAAVMPATNQAAPAPAQPVPASNGGAGSGGAPSGSAAA